MSFVIGTLLSIAAVLFGIVLWQRLPDDRVGFQKRERKRHTGFQGQMTEWLYWDAVLRAPQPKHLLDQTRDRSRDVGDRALVALVHRYASEHRMGVDEAHKALRKAARSEAARLFVSGRMHRAIRRHWWTRYTGPDFLFYPWFYLIASIRYGKRHLYLETLSAVLTELRTT